MNFKRLVGALVLSGFLVLSPIVTLPVLAVLDANVSASISSITGDLTITIQQPVGTDIDDFTIYKIPAGFDIASGSSIPNNAPIGSGTFTGIFGGTELTFPFVILNDTNLAAHKLRFKADFAPQPVVIDVFVDGDVLTGHTFQVNTPQPVTFTSPLTTIFNFSRVVQDVSLFTLPTLAGEYIFEVEFHKGVEVVTKSYTVNFPATTPSGINVTNNFNGGISVNFDRVLGTGGETTITSSTTAPAPGTGEFQVDGLYYDFNTTANIKCPCTITLPYNPDVTPTPRIYHLEDGVWTDVTTYVDTTNHTVTGVVSSFSFFAVGEPNYSVLWNKAITKLIELKGNPFPLEEDKDLGIKFNLEDSDDQLATPENVTVEIWQIADSAGNPLEEAIKAVTLIPEINQTLQRFQTKLDVEEAGLVLGTYDIIVMVENTTATQTPSTASFTVVED